MSDDFHSAGEARRRFRPFSEFLVALRFLTRLPVPFLRTLDPPPLQAAMGMFPLAGAIVGVLSGLVLVFGKQIGLPEFFCAILAIATAALITGGLHEDGLSDMVDGFGGGRTLDQRLEIMHDSRVGAYGALALCLVTLGRASLLVSLLEMAPLDTILLLASAAAFSRALMVDFMWATKPARRDGLSVAAGRPSRNTTLLALAIGGFLAGIAASYVLTPIASIAAMAGAGMTLAIVRALSVRKIGGQTGDTIGASQVLTEITMLAIYSATLSLPSFA